jgi:hypothetical protein
MADEHPGASSTHAAGGGESPPVDVGALSDKVYRLLLADVRLESARAGRGPGRG